MTPVLTLTLDLLPLTQPDTSTAPAPHSADGSPSLQDVSVTHGARCRGAPLVTATVEPVSASVW